MSIALTTVSDIARRGRPQPVYAVEIAPLYRVRVKYMIDRNAFPGDKASEPDMGETMG